MRTAARSVTALALGLGLGVAGGGCGAPSGSGPDATRPDPIASPTPTLPTPILSERGNVVVSPGDDVRAAVDDQTATLIVTVEDISVVPTCPGRAVPVQEPSLGHFVVLDVTASLEPVGPGSGGEQPYAGLGAERFRLVAPNGAVQDVSSTEESWACFEPLELLPGFVDAGETVSGLVVLDSADQHGAVVFSAGSGAGWEWRF
jgi:hypothetical protein